MNHVAQTWQLFPIKHKGRQDGRACQRIQWADQGDLILNSPTPQDVEELQTACCFACPAIPIIRSLRERFGKTYGVVCMFVIDNVCELRSWIDDQSPKCLHKINQAVSP